MDKINNTFYKGTIIFRYEKYQNIFYSINYESIFLLFEDIKYPDIIKYFIPSVNM